jgi:alkylation response protein AidB-like acyl-CoA dehydrogenase
MDFDFSPEQHALRDAVRSTLANAAPSDYVRAMLEDERGFTDELWSALSELGWTGVLIPEEHGGLGLGLVDMVVLQEEMGKLPLPGPFFSSAIFATLAARRLGADELLADLASGAQRGTVAIEETSSRDPLAGVQTRATPAGDGWTLDGVKPVVLDGHTADWVIVAARTDEGLGAFLVTSPQATPVKTFDDTRKTARLAFEGTPARRLGTGDATPALRRVMDDAAVALAAELVGCCEQALALASDYASVREQFGRPIGKFQAIRHMAAEMLQRTELTRVGTHYAAWVSDTDQADRERAAAMIKAWAAESAISVTGDCIQIHGGVGFTWEADPHLFYKRAKSNDLLFGQQGWQRTRVADLFVDATAEGVPA